MASISPEQNAEPAPQLLLVGEKDKKRLLEVYVKRTMSLNDGSRFPYRQENGTNKWVTVTEKTRHRRHSSDTSLNVTSQVSFSKEDIRYEPFSEPPLDKKETLPEKKSIKWRIKDGLCRNDGSVVSQKSNSKPKKWLHHLDKGKEEDGQNSDASPPQTITVTAGDINSNMVDNVESSTVEKKDKESKKAKKATVWKNFLSWFSKGNTQKEQEHQKTEEELPLSQPSTPRISCLPLPDGLSKGDVNLRQSKSLRKKHEKNRRSFKWRQSGDMSTRKSAIEMVEPTSSYYEKMSEEMKKIVHEVKDSPAGNNSSDQTTDVKLSQDEVIRRIVELIKCEGDLINAELKQNSTMSSYLDNISYKCFQQMADQYVQSEVSNKKTHQPIVAPELVKLAFTLDFTARVANLHHQATGQIMGFGNQYLQDRFTHMSESHPHLPQNSEQEFMSLQ